MANNNNEDIQIKISVDTSDVEKSMKDVSKQADNMSKRMEKSGDKVEKSFDDLKKSAKDIQSSFKKIDMKSLTSGLSNMKKQVTQIATSIKKQLQDALNIKGNIDAKVNVTTDSSSGANSSAIESAMGSIASGGAIGSQIAKQMATSSKDILQLTDSIKRAFGQIPESVQENIKETVSNIYDTIDDIVPIIEQLRDTTDIDLSDPKELKGLILGMQDDVKVMSQATENGMQKLVKWKEKLSSSGEDVSWMDDQMQLQQAEIDHLNVKLKQLKGTLADASKLDFILNLDTNESVMEIDRLLAKFDEMPNRMNKADVEPIIQQMKSFKQQMQSLGIDTSFLNDVFTEWEYVCNTGSKATVKLTNEMLKARQNISSLQQGTKQLISTQTMQIQKQQELASATNNFQKAIIQAKYGFKQFASNLKSLFSSIKSNSKVLDETGKKVKKLGQETKQASKQIKSATTGIAASFKSLLTSILPFMTIIGAFNLLKDSTTKAMDAIEDTNMYMAVFGSRAKEMDAWIEQLSKDTGLGIGQTKKFTAIIQQMGSAMGLTGQDAMEMSQSMAKMAGDISSFYNVDITQAQEDLRSALSGSNEVLTKYGIVLRENTIQQYAYANGLARTGSQLTAAQRAMTLTLMIEQQLGQANGDLARTMDTPAGRARRLAVAFEQLKVSLGNIVLPIWNAVMPGLIALANALTAIFNKIASVINGILSLFGMGLKIGGGGGLVKDAESLGDSLGSAGSGAGDVADNLGSAADSAQKIQKSLMGIDEINNLSSPDSGSGGGSGGSGGGGGGGGGIDGLDSTVVKETDSFVDSISEEFTRLKELFRDFLAGFNTTFDASALLQIKEHLINIKNHLLDIASDPLVQDSFNMMTRQWAMTFGAFVGTLAQIGTQITLGLVGGIDQSLAQNKEHIKQKLVEIFDVKSEIAIEFRKGLYGISEIAKSFGSDEAKQMVANLVTGITNASLEFILLGNKIGRDLIHGITQPIYDNQDEIREALETTFGGIGDAIKVVMDNVELILSKFNTFYDVHVKPFVDSVVSGWSEIYGTLLDGYNKYMKPTFDKIVGHLKNFFETYIQPTVDKILGALGKLFGALKDYWENTLQPLINWIAQFIYPVIAPIIDMVVRVVLDGIGACIVIIGDIIAWIIDFIAQCVQMSADVGKAFGYLKDLVIEHCTRLWNKAKEIWESLGGDIKTVVQNLKQMAIDKFIEIKDKVIEKCQELKQKAEEKWQEIKTAIMEKITQFKEDAIEKVKETKEDIIEKFNELIQPIKDVWDGIWKHISPIIEKLKNAFDFEWKLPEIKLPKVNITKKVGLFGLEYPSFDVSWNAAGGIFDSPTIFNTARGFQGVGEAGAEAILPLDTLWQQMNRNFEKQTETLARMNNNNNQQTTLVLQLDGREVARGTFRNAGDLARIGQLNLDWL